MVLVLQVLRRRRIDGTRLQVEPGSFVRYLDDEVDARDPRVDADAFLRVVRVAAENCVRKRLGERDWNVEAQLMCAKLHELTLSPDELHDPLDLAYVAGNFQLHDAGGGGATVVGGLGL